MFSEHILRKFYRVTSKKASYLSRIFLNAIHLINTRHHQEAPSTTDTNYKILRLYMLLCYINKTPSFLAFRLHNTQNVQNNLVCI